MLKNETRDFLIIRKINVISRVEMKIDIAKRKKKGRRIWEISLQNRLLTELEGRIRTGNWVSRSPAFYF